MRSRLLFLLLVTLSLSPLVVHADATGIPYFGPIVPNAVVSGSGTGGSAPCAAAWGSVVQLLSNAVAFFVTLAIVFVAPLMLAYAGFLFVVNPVNAGGMNQAKSILIHTLTGIVIALCAWLIVNTILSVISTNSLTGWTQGLNPAGSAKCLALNMSVAANTNTNSNPGVSSTGNGSSASGSGAQCSSSNPACSVSSLEGDGMTSAQANVMSCIAVTESSGNPSTPPYNQAHPGSNSTACGTFQITQTTWNGAASGACSSFSNCQNAACNAQVAQTLVSQSGYSPWTCPGCNNKAAGCVQKYGGG
jgi:hypothetical protein